MTRLRSGRRRRGSWRGGTAGVGERPDHGRGSAARDATADRGPSDGDAGPRPLDAPARKGLRAALGVGSRVTTEQEPPGLDAQTQDGQGHARQHAAVDAQGHRHAGGDHAEAEEEEHRRTHRTTLGADRFLRVALFGSSWAP